MKKQLKKGFTLVELVIVIAVIAILAAVLIPTFAGVIDKSKKSAALQEATSANTAMVIASEGTPITGSYIKVIKGDYWFLVGDNGALTAKKAPEAMTTCWEVTSKNLKDLSANVIVYSKIIIASDEADPALPAVKEGALTAAGVFTAKTGA